VSGYTAAIGNGSAWSPDGRIVNPLTALDTDSRTAMLNSFNGLDPNGSWTFFLADLSSGEVSTVAKWGLNIEAERRALAVPDTGATLPLLGLVVAGLTLFHGRRSRSALSKPPRAS
jgi:hypothetical protein